MTLTGNPRTLDRAQRSIEASIERWCPDLIRLSHEIHADPELSGEEFRAAERTRSVLRRAGFRFDAVQPSAPTAFCALSGSGELVVVLCVEYDALPGIGHACGHNVNAATAVGAAIGLACVAGKLGVTVKVLGTPAEETTGGKVDLLEEGWFDDASLALMAHAGGSDEIGGSSLALSNWEIRFEGHAAHAAVAPEEGVNALDALVVAQTALGLARQQLPRGSVVSYVTREGGEAVNVIPELARASIEMRAPSVTSLRVIEDKVRRCLEAGALASGAALAVSPYGSTFAELCQDDVLAAAYCEAMAARGRHVAYSEVPIASTDMGNVSQKVPAIHPMLGYQVDGAVHHSAGFTACGTTGSADRAILDGAFGLAAAGAAAALRPDRFRSAAGGPR